MRIHKFSIGRLRGVHVSSIVNKGNRAILNLFFFFLQEDFTRTKSTKRKQANENKKDRIFIHIKTSKRKKIAFLTLANEGIRVILNLFIFFCKKISHAEKAQNAFKRTKTKKTAFLCTWKHLTRRKSLVWRFVLFVLFTLFMLFVVFVVFVHVKSSCKKKNKEV